MISLSLVTFALATIGAYAKPTTRAVGGLEVSLSTPANKVASVSDLRVVANVKNVGDEDVRILRLGTVLDDELPTRSFIVTKDGKEAPFTGIRVSVDFDQISEDDWVVIPAGKTVTAEHNVSTVYDFSTSGPGTFTFDPVSTFQVTGPNNTVKVIPGAARTNTANSGSISITITDDVSKRELSLEKRAQIQCSDPKKKSFIADSLIDARFMNLAASIYIGSRGGDDPLYKAYFGSNPISSATAILEAIAAENSPTRIMGCMDPVGGCKKGTVAYSVVTTGDIYYCDPFYKEQGPGSLCTGGSVKALNLRGGTTLHELAHAVANVDDFTYKCSDAQNLPDPDKVRSATNYECFVAQVYSDTRCHGK